MKKINKFILLGLGFSTVGVVSADTLDEFTYELGGKLRLRSDYMNGLYTNTGDSENENYLRRADLSVKGKLWQFGTYEVETKTANDGKTKVKTALWTYPVSKHLHLVAGRFDPDFGLELSGSSSWITGIERSSLWDLAPYAGDGDESWGGGVRYHRKHWFAGAQLFDSPNGGQSSGRLVYAPINTKSNVLHIGVSYSAINGDYTDGKIKSDLSIYGVGRSKNGNSTKLAKDKSLGVFDSDKVAAVEASYQYGPFSAQAEYLKRSIESDSGAFNREADGYYLQLAYTITGESRDFNMDLGKYGKIKPNSKFGAWEVFLRHDSLNTHGEIGMLSHKRNRGEATVNALGVNWYSQDHWKLSLNALNAETPDIPNDAGDLSGKGASFQVQYKF